MNNTNKRLDYKGELVKEDTIVGSGKFFDKSRLELDLHNVVVGDELQLGKEVVKVVPLYPGSTAVS